MIAVSIKSRFAHQSVIASPFFNFHRCGVLNIFIMTSVKEAINNALRKYDPLTLVLGTGATIGFGWLAKEILSSSTDGTCDVSLIPTSRSRL